MLKPIARAAPAISLEQAAPKGVPLLLPLGVFVELGTATGAPTVAEGLVAVVVVLAKSGAKKGIQRTSPEMLIRFFLRYEAFSSVQVSWKVQALIQSSWMESMQLHRFCLGVIFSKAPGPMNPKVDIVSASQLADCFKAEDWMQVIHACSGAVIVWAETTVLRDVATMKATADAAMAEKRILDLACLGFLGGLVE